MASTGRTSEPSAQTRALVGFADRASAGRVLADWVRPLIGSDTLVVGIAGGGIVLAELVARTLGLRLEGIVAEPVFAPGLAGATLAAVCGDGTEELDRSAMARLGVPERTIGTAIDDVSGRTRRRAALLGADAASDLRGRRVLLVDESLDPPVVTAAAVSSLRKRRPAWIVAAAPVADRAARRFVACYADDAVAVLTPEAAAPRAAWYRDLPAYTDADVARCLIRARAIAAAAGH